MNPVWIYSLASVFVVSAISLIGAFALYFQKGLSQRVLFILVSLSAGAIFGDVFLHLLPELAEKNNLTLSSSFYVLVGIILFFVLEKFIIWRHCHVADCGEHPRSFAYTNLIGDALHNFIDGMIIAGAYLISVPIGIATTLAVIFHEIPQEIGDFGILIYAGFGKTKALIFNFLSALAAVFGALVVLVIGAGFESFLTFVVSLTIGVFIYIAGSDLIPELHKEQTLGKSFIQLLFFLLGIGLMAMLLFLRFEPNG